MSQIPVSTQALDALNAFVVETDDLLRIAQSGGDDIQKTLIAAENTLGTLQAMQCPLMVTV